MKGKRLLDVFCGAGGGARGYYRAGFTEIVGIDIKPQPNYPFDFVRMDFVDLFTQPYPHYWRDADLVHASPPCQAYSDLANRNGNGNSHPRFIEALREMLDSTNRDWVIENVEGAPLFEPLVLCGTMFPGLRVLRHRLFEFSYSILQRGKPVAPEHPKHPLVFTHDKRKAHYGKLNESESFVSVNGGGNCSVATARAAMDIDWMTKDELNESDSAGLHGVDRKANLRGSMNRYSPLKRTGFQRKKYSWRKPSHGGLRRTRLRAKPDRKLAAWSKAVRERDGNVCQWPGGCQTGDTRIDVHHIAKRSQRPDLKYEPSNLICLCRTHHEQTDTNKAEAVANGMLNLESRELARKAA